MKYFKCLSLVLIIVAFVLGVCVGGYLTQPNLPKQLSLLQNSKLHEAMRAIVDSKHFLNALQEAELLYQQADYTRLQNEQLARELTERLQKKFSGSMADGNGFVVPASQEQTLDSVKVIGKDLELSEPSFSKPLTLKVPKEVDSVNTDFKSNESYPNFFAPSRPSRFDFSTKLLWDEGIDTTEMSLIQSLDAVEGMELELQFKLP